jgi:hypothetical protein
MPATSCGRLILWRGHRNLTRHWSRRHGDSDGQLSSEDSSSISLSLIVGTTHDNLTDYEKCNSERC